MNMLIYICRSCIFIPIYFVVFGFIMGIMFFGLLTLFSTSENMNLVIEYLGCIDYQPIKNFVYILKNYINPPNYNQLLADPPLILTEINPIETETIELCQICQESNKIMEATNKKTCVQCTFLCCKKCFNSLCKNKNEVKCPMCRNKYNVKNYKQSRTYKQSIKLSLENLVEITKTHVVFSHEKEKNVLMSYKVPLNDGMLSEDQYDVSSLINVDFFETWNLGPFIFGYNNGIYLTHSKTNIKLKITEFDYNYNKILIKINDFSLLFERFSFKWILLDSSHSSILINPGPFFCGNDDERICCDISNKMKEILIL